MARVATSQKHRSGWCTQSVDVVVREQAALRPNQIVHERCQCLGLAAEWHSKANVIET